MRKFLLLLFMLTITLLSFAQHNITGRITDVEGRPISGASVRVPNTTVGTTSNDDGYFSLASPATARVFIVSICWFMTDGFL